MEEENVQKYQELRGEKVKWTKEGGGEASTSTNFQSRRKEGYDKQLTNPNGESIVAFVKDHEGHYDKTNEYFKDKPRQDFLCETFASRRKYLRKC